MAGMRAGMRADVMAASSALTTAAQKVHLMAAMTVAKLVERRVDKWGSKMVVAMADGSVGYLVEMWVMMLVGWKVALMADN